MAAKKRSSGDTSEIADLLKKNLVLQLFQLDVSQATIARKLKLSVNVVNDLLKGIKKRG